MKPTLAVDFDNTIYDGYKVIDGCIDVLTDLRQMYKIAIFSARPTDGERQHMKTVLDSSGVPYDEILGVKPEFVFLVDDKAIRFDGDWNEVRTRILNAK
jgi:hypothetical protein